MSNVLKSIRLDNYILKAYYKTFIVVYVIAILIGIISQIPALTVVVVMVITAPFIGTYFSVYEKNNLNKLYGILPIGKYEVVIGRYLYALFLGIINGIVSGILAYIISIFINKGMDHLTFITCLSASFLYFCLFIAVEFPVYFKYAFSKVYIFTSLPFYLVFVVGAFIFKKTDILQYLSQIIQYFTSHQNMIWVTGIGLGLILLIISCPLSYFIYKKNEL
ncbi:MAG TPA: ABC-2 transporter permease [Clostridia bacterium]|nr:ABC-2 transporter permease [Clostridia bacterium]